MPTAARTQRLKSGRTNLLRIDKSEVPPSLGRVASSRCAELRRTRRSPKGEGGSKSEVRRPKSEVRGPKCEIDNGHRTTDLRARNPAPNDRAGIEARPNRHFAF